MATMDEMKSLLAKDRDSLTDDERKSVEDYLLDRAPQQMEKEAPQKKADVSKAASVASKKAAEASTTSEQRRMAKVKADEDAVMASRMKQAQMRPNKPSAEDFAKLREIDEEIRKLQERRKKLPFSRDIPSDMERGSDMSYEDMLLRD